MFHFLFDLNLFPLFLFSRTPTFWWMAFVDDNNRSDDSRRFALRDQTTVVSRASCFRDDNRQNSRTVTARCRIKCRKSMFFARSTIYVVGTPNTLNIHTSDRKTKNIVRPLASRLNDSISLNHIKLVQLRSEWNSQTHCSFKWIIKKKINVYSSS